MAIEMNVPQMMHAARLASLEAALSALLREAQTDVPFDTPDAVIVTFDSFGMDIQFTAEGVAVSGEGM